MEFQILEATSKSTLTDSIATAVNEDGWTVIGYSAAYDGSAVLYTALLSRMAMSAMSWWQRIMSRARRK